MWIVSAPDPTDVTSPLRLLTRSGDVIHPQLRPLGLGPRLRCAEVVWSDLQTGDQSIAVTLLLEVQHSSKSSLPHQPNTGHTAHVGVAPFANYLVTSTHSRSKLPGYQS